MDINVSWEKMRRKKVFMATPMYGGQNAGIFLRSVQALSVDMCKTGIGLNSHYLFNESLITRARNYCADEFLRSDCTHLLFVDSDIGFDPVNIFQMMAISDEEDPDCPYDVLCGPYAKKSIAWEKIKAAVDKGVADKDPRELENYVGDFVFNPLPTNSGEYRLDEPMEILEGGTGMMLIKRSAFQKFDSKWKPRLEYRPDHVRNPMFNGHRAIMGYFMDPVDRWDREAYYRQALEKIASVDQMNETMDDVLAIVKEALAHAEPETLRHLSEDYFFCQHLRKAGGRVWLCPWFKTEHVGSFSFSGTLMHLAGVQAHATADPAKMPQAPGQNGPVQQSPADVIVPANREA
jgi:glycosyltransferase involved in cell wall biosynthesis